MHPVASLETTSPAGAAMAHETDDPTTSAKANFLKALGHMAEHWAGLLMADCICVLRLVLPCFCL